MNTDYFTTGIKSPPTAGWVQKGTFAPLKIGGYAIQNSMPEPPYYTQALPTLHLILIDNYRIYMLILEYIFYKSNKGIFMQKFYTISKEKFNYLYNKIEEIYDNIKIISEFCNIYKDTEDISIILSILKYTLKSIDLAYVEFIEMNIDET